MMFFKNLEESSGLQGNALQLQNEKFDFSNRISYILSRENDEDLEDVDLEVFNNF